MYQSEFLSLSLRISPNVCKLCIWLFYLCLLKAQYTSFQGLLIIFTKDMTWKSQGSIWCNTFGLIRPDLCLTFQGEEIYLSWSFQVRWLSKHYWDSPQLTVRPLEKNLKLMIWFPSRCNLRKILEINTQPAYSKFGD
mgnify:CR=1 FL=1